MEFLKQDPKDNTQIFFKKIIIRQQEMTTRLAELWKDI